MAVFNGQIANQTTFNNAFASKQNDNILAGVQTFANETNATSLSSAAVVLAGGLSVAKQLRLGTNMFVGGTWTGTDGTESTDTLTGAIVTTGGVGIGKNLNVGGNGAFTGDLGANNLSGTNTGDVTEATFGATPNGNGFSILPTQQIRLQPADQTNPGGVSVVAQTFAGAKTFADPVSMQQTLGVTGNVDIDGELDVALAATFQNNVTVQGNFEVLGTTTTLDTETVQTADNNIEVNLNGTDLSAENGGLTVIRTSTNGSFRFDSTLTSNWKLGLLGAEVEVADVSSAQAFTNKTVTDTTNAVFAVQGSAVSPVVIAAAAGISIGDVNDETIFIQSTGGSVTVTATPQIGAGSKVGQRLKIVCKDTVNGVNLTDGNGLDLNGLWEGGDSSALDLTWDGSVWHETSRRT